MHDVLLVVCCYAVVGEKEQSNNTVNVRTRDNHVHGELNLDDLIARLLRLKKSRVNSDLEEFPK